MTANVSFDELTKGDGIIKIKRDLHLPQFTITGYFKYLKNKNTVLNNRLAEKKQKDVQSYEEEETKLLHQIEYETGELA